MSFVDVLYANGTPIAFALSVILASCFILKADKLFMNAPPVSKPPTEFEKKRKRLETHWVPNPKRPREEDKAKEEEDKAKIQKEPSILTDPLQQIGESLARETVEPSFQTPQYSSVAERKQAEKAATQAKISEEERRRLSLISEISSFFTRADVDGDSLITLDEFKQALADPSMTECIKKLRIPPAMTSEELFVSLDHEGKGVLTASDLVDGLREGEGPRATPSPHPRRRASGNLVKS